MRRLLGRRTQYDTEGQKRKYYKKKLTSLDYPSRELYKVLELEEKYIALFNPKRSKSIIKYGYNIFSSMYSLIGSKLNKNKEYYNNNPIFIKDKAIYVDKYKVKHIVYNKTKYNQSSEFFVDYYGGKRIHNLIDNLKKYKHLKKHNKNDLYLVDLLK